MASPVAISLNDSTLDWKKMNKQELRDALASRGLDTNGLRPSLIHRLESSCKAAAAAALASEVESMDSENPNLNPSNPTSATSPKTLLLPQEATDNRVSNSNGAIAETNETETALKKASENRVSQHPKPQTALQSEEIEKQKEKNQACINGSTGSLTDLEKKQKRAERFGVELQVSEEEKRRIRASRFGGTQAKNKVPVIEPENEKRKQRAARFGIVDDDTRKKARQERFDSASKPNNSTESDKRKSRAARFGTSTAQKDLNADGKAETRSASYKVIASSEGESRG